MFGSSSTNMNHQLNTLWYRNRVPADNNVIETQACSGVLPRYSQSELSGLEGKHVLLLWRNIQQVCTTEFSLNLSNSLEFYLEGLSFQTDNDTYSLGV